MAKSEKPEKPGRPTRPYWKGYLRLALVTIPVQVHTATDSAGKIRLNQIHKPSGQRVNYTVTSGGKEVEEADIVKGYPVAEDTYVTLDQEELAIKLETKKTLDVHQFVKPRKLLRPSTSGPITSFPKTSSPSKATRSFTLP